MMYRGCIGWVSSKVITRIIIGPSLFGAQHWRLVPKSTPWTTLIGRYILYFTIRWIKCYSEPTTKIWKKINPYMAKMQAVTLVFGNVTFMMTFAGDLWRRSVKQHYRSSKTTLFSFGVNIFGIVWIKANLIIHCYLTSHWLSTDPKTDDLEWSWMANLRLWQWSFCTFCRGIALFDCTTYLRVFVPVLSS